MSGKEGPALEPRGAWAEVLSDDYSVADAVGGWRGMVESALPGVVFVASYLIWGGYRTPIIAAVGCVLALVAIRLIQRTPVTQALAGLIGIGIGAAWAWWQREPGEFYLPGLVTNAVYAVGLIVSIAVKWPAVGVVASLAKGQGMGWRERPDALRTFAKATWVLVAMFALRLAVQVPLYLTDSVAALGVARLAMGLPLFALTLWVVWWLVRGVAAPPADPDPPQQTG